MATLRLPAPRFSSRFYDEARRRRGRRHMLLATTALASLPYVIFCRRCSKGCRFIFFLRRFFSRAEELDVFAEVSPRYDIALDAAADALLAFCECRRAVAFLPPLLFRYAQRQLCRFMRFSFHAAPYALRC